MLKPDEQLVLDALVLAWNRFCKLTPVHPDDHNEFRYSMHALQNIILARPALKFFNGNIGENENAETTTAQATGDN